MRANNVKDIWAKGGHVVNGWLAIPSSVSAEIMTHAGFDSVTVDLQHGLVDYQASVGMLQAISTLDVTPMLRVPWNDPIPIMKALDAGAYGIVCPMINNREEAEKFVGACRYYPDGYRSFGPARAAMYAGADYATEANSTVITMAMIETRPALDNLDEIMSTPGLDAIYVGPADLSISLGHPPSGDPSVPEVLEAYDSILAAAKRNGVVAGSPCADGAMANRLFEKGFQFCTIANDSRLLAISAAEQIAAARGGQ
ncbi:MAG: aldolase/citrate lyase family protein [Alphaproteobacteria bacterium]|nr:aldolase/citrate lyase family protein [Alphaproteobacteria bacterium]